MNSKIAIDCGVKILDQLDLKTPINPNIGVRHLVQDAIDEASKEKDDRIMELEKGLKDIVETDQLGSGMYGNAHSVIQVIKVMILNLIKSGPNDANN